jgi:hypothetical protein
MTFYIVVRPGEDRLAEISKLDIGFVQPGAKVEFVKLENNVPSEQLQVLSNLKLETGDVICLAGLCVRRTTIDIIELAKNTKQNYMPGVGIDHRTVPILPGKISIRQPIEKNYQTAWPYLMVIGNPESAITSFKIFEQLEPSQYWTNYVPDTPDLIHLLGVVSVTGFWQTPEWFKLVDLSIRDLEIARVMYASHMWHDWIAFYPANGNFKLENHSQLHPVWLAGSEKPLEHWKRG